MLFLCFGAGVGVRKYWIPTLSDSDRGEIFSAGLFHLILAKHGLRSDDAISDNSPVMKLELLKFLKGSQWLSKVSAGFTFPNIQNFFVWTKIYREINTARNKEASKNDSSIVLKCARLALKVCWLFMPHK